MTCWILAQVVTSLMGVAHPGQSAEYALTGLAEPPDQNVVKLSINIGDTEVHEDASYQWIHLSGLKQNGQTYSVWMLVDQ